MSQRGGEDPRKMVISQWFHRTSPWKMVGLWDFMVISWDFMVISLTKFVCGLGHVEWCYRWDQLVTWSFAAGEIWLVCCYIWRLSNLEGPAEGVVAQKSPWQMCGWWQEGIVQCIQSALRVGRIGEKAATRLECTNGQWCWAPDRCRNFVSTTATQDKLLLIRFFWQGLLVSSL